MTSAFLPPDASGWLRRVLDWREPDLEDRLRTAVNLLSGREPGRTWSFSATANMRRTTGLTKAAAEFLDQYGEPEPNSGCWLSVLAWDASRPYVRMSAVIRREFAHRIAYRLQFGPIPAGTELDHLCAMPPCINPLHLEPVPHQVNLRRVYERNWSPFPSKGTAPGFSSRPFEPERAPWTSSQ